MQVASAANSLTGKFIYDGTPPERKKLVVEKDVECCGKHDLRDETLIVDEKGGLANVFLYFVSRDMPVTEAAKATLATPVVLDNLDCVFKPRCLTITVGQKFEIINSDPVPQNVAFSPRGDTPANIVLPVDGKATYTFTRRQTSPVFIACNYHPWESGYILPRETPYACVSLADGTFRIENLPEGKWEVQLWHEKVGRLELPDKPRGRFEVEIKAGENDLGEIKVPPKQLLGA